MQEFLCSCKLKFRQIFLRYHTAAYPFKSTLAETRRVTLVSFTDILQSKSLRIHAERITAIPATLLKGAGGEKVTANPCETSVPHCSLKKITEI